MARGAVVEYLLTAIIGWQGCALTARSATDHTGMFRRFTMPINVLVTAALFCALSILTGAVSAEIVPAYARPKSSEGVLIAFCTEPRISVPLCQNVSARKRILESTGGAASQCDSVIWQTFLLALKVHAVERTGARDCGVARSVDRSLLEAHPTAEDPKKTLYIPRPGAEFKTKSGTPRCIVFISSLTFSEKSLGGGFRAIELNAVYAIWDTKYNAARSAGQSSDTVNFTDLATQNLEDLAAALAGHLFGDITLSRW